MNNKQFVCSRCGKEWEGFPAISRLDNQTEICSPCGTEEALLDYYNRLPTK